MIKTLPLSASLALALALGACAPLAAPDESPPPPQGDGEAYFALGTEPFWSLEITPARLNFHVADGFHLAIANPGARPSFNGERYVAERTSVDVTHSPCSDGMSDRRYADTVTVEAGGRTWRGCGGMVLAPTSLADTRWRIVFIDGVAPVGDRPAEIAFADGRLSGSAGCNRLSGSYNSDGTRFTAGPIAATRMACAPNVTAQEARVTAILGGPLAMRFNDRGRLVLSADGGGVLVLERAE